MRARTNTPLAFIAGISAGMAAGMLFAPHKGKITRAKLKQRMEENVERAEEKALDTRTRVKSNVDKLKKDQ